MNYEVWQMPLIAKLEEYGVDQSRIDDVIDSGYILRGFWDSFSKTTRDSVSDCMYGNKQFSSVFEIEKFIEYLNGDNAFPSHQELPRYVASSRADIDQILSDERRAYYIGEGSLVFRGQTRQHTFRRKIPNPVRADSSGEEISIFPGIYRQNSQYYSFASAIESKEIPMGFLRLLEPDPDIELGFVHYDIMRTQQHYLCPTAGLDITFDMDVALFFATHQFEQAQDGTARYRKVASGDHEGIIYCFRFRDPPVKKTQFFISEFDLFKTYPPERILRQSCGLPLIGDYERNIALCDIDCVIQLNKDFDESTYDPMHLFPPTSTDLFYARLLELRERIPDVFGTVVEYEWATQ
jgi:hypothetical protein